MKEFIKIIEIDKFDLIGITKTNFKVKKVEKDNNSQSDMKGGIENHGRIHSS